MNIKKLIGGIVLATTMTVGVGVGLGATLGNSEIKVEKAEAAGTTWYYVGSSFWMNDSTGAATETTRGAAAWSFDSNTPELTQGTTYIWTLGNYEYFKFASQKNWDGTNIGGSVISGTAVTSGVIEKAPSDDNILCKTAGVYEITIESSSSIKINYPTYLNATANNCKIYRFTNSKSWTDVYAYPFGSATTANNPQWANSFKLNNYSYNENSEKVYYFITNVTDYSGIIFRSVADNKQTWDITIGSDTAWYCQDVSDGKYSYGTWTPENVTYYFYDYENGYSGDVKVYAWASNSGGRLENSAYASSPASTKVSNTSRVYSISLDPMFDEVIFHNSDDSVKTDDTFVNQNHGNAFTRWSSSSTQWLSYEKVVGHDWVNLTMHLWDYDASHDNTGATNACYGTDGTDGYYAIAYTAYNSFNNDIRTSIAGEDNYALAYERFQDWAKACGKTVSISESGGTYTITQNSARVGGIITQLNGTTQDVAIITIILSALALTAVAGYFFLRKKREN